MVIRNNSIIYFQDICDQRFLKYYIKTDQCKCNVKIFEFWNKVLSAHSQKNNKLASK